METKTTAAPGEGDLERGKTDQPVDPSPNPPGPHPGPYSQQNYAEDPNGKEGRFMRQMASTTELLLPPKRKWRIVCFS